MAGSHESSRTTSELPGLYELSWLSPSNMGRSQKIHTNREVQIWFANFRVNRPCFRLDRRERYCTIRKWPRSLFRPVQARSRRNARDQDGTRTGRDGPHLRTWMGPKCCRTKHMANLDGTPSDPGWDLDGPRIRPRRGSGWHPQKQ